MDQGTIAKNVEQQARDAVSEERLQQHLEIFSTLFRDSGSEDEWQAARYIVDQMRSYGIAAELLELESLISWPLEGKLEILDDLGQAGASLPARPRAFGAQTPPGGIEVEVVFVPFAAPEPGAMIFSHRAVAGDYTGVDAAGKAVLTADGGPDGIRRAQEQGAIAHIHIWPSDEPVVHEMIATSVWGTPTPESAARLPTIPVLGLSKGDGERLASQIERGPVRVRVESNVRTEWMRVPLPVATIPGSASADFLLVGAHIDSWYEGITDNATGDAALIEMARILHAHRGALRRGVRFCWWPGHSTGRYSGSTWYADTHFRELRERCIGYLNIDSPGTRGATIWDCRYNMGEVENLTAAVVRELSGQDPNIRRPLKAGDQSFLGVGLPSLGAFRMLPVDHPDRKAVGGCGGAWWWHTPADTLDKADASILADDTRVYLTLTLRMCTPEVIPYTFAPSARDFIEHLTALQEEAGQHLDLSETIRAARAFQAAAERLAGTPIGEVAQVNTGLKQLTRIVNPALYTIAGPYEFDPALQLPVLPGLAPLRDLARLDPNSDAFHFLLTKLRRQRNRIEDALAQATEVATRLTR
jgi:N-acetylated-alpha-linked acidic dipeptidase